MVTKTQLDRLTSRVQRLGAAINPKEAIGVPIYAGETKQEAVAAYEKKMGPIDPGTPIEFNGGRPGQIRADAANDPADFLSYLNSRQMDELIKSCDGRRSLADYKRPSSRKLPNERE